MGKRVVITGLGVVSSIGIGKEEFWSNLLEGKSGISNIVTFDTSGYSTGMGGEIKDFRPADHLPIDKIKNNGRASQFSIVASKLAFEDANIDPSRYPGISVFMGTTLADAQSLEQIDKHWLAGGEDDIWDINILKYPGYNLSNSISRFFGLQGSNFVIPTACAAGNYCLGFAYDLLKNGEVDIAIAGGSDPIARTNFSGFDRLKAMAPVKCQPFDKNRKGMMVGEGSGVLVMETLENAIERGTEIYGEVLGYGLSCDAYNMTIPNVEGIEKVMRNAFVNSSVDKKDIGYICAHGTGTLANDKTEIAAIKRVFKESAKDLSISSIKSMLGHTMGAASAIEAIACCLALQNNILPPTINLESPDPELGLDFVANCAREKKLKKVLNNSFAFGGNNASLVLGEI